MDMNVTANEGEDELPDMELKNRDKDDGEGNN
jgi:hypothetical protein